MLSVRLLSAAEQVAAYLGGHLAHGLWSDTMPGVSWLTAKLRVNRKTVVAALRLLEKEGRISGQGPGRKRLIVQKKRRAARPMRVALLLYEPADHYLNYVVQLQHALVEAGHSAVIAPKSLTELKMEVPRVARLVRQNAADAWVVAAGSREVLKWFCAQAVPTFALFGRWEGLPIAATGPDKQPAMTAASRQLLDLGHRRIVLLARQERRAPEPGRTERAFLDEMKGRGVPASDYNLPDWEETVEGLQALLNSLFRVTPPTAIIVEEAQFLVATLQALGRRGLRVPEHVSLLCTDDNPLFAWCQPAISRIRWDSGPVIRRIVRWAATVSRGRKDIRQTLSATEFFEGGTIGPVPVG